MRPIQAPLSQGQTGDEVANLQEILMEFLNRGIIDAGINIVPDNSLATEYSQKYFGNATARTVNEYCNMRGISAPTQPPLVNDYIAGLLNASFTEMYATVDIVFSGYVRDSSGQPLTKDYRVHISGIKFNDFVDITTVVVDKITGWYSYTYTVPKEQYTSKGSYNVYVREATKSQLLDSRDIFQAGTTISVDFTVTEQQVLPEYSAIHAAVMDIIGDIPINELDPDDPSQIQRIAQLTGENTQQVSMVLQARKISESLGSVGEANVYALLRQNIDTTPAILLNQPKEVVKKALEVSVVNNQIPALSTAQIEAFATTLTNAVTTQIAYSAAWHADEQQPTFVIASNVLENIDYTQQFIKATSSFVNSGETDFWAHVAREAPALDITALKVATNMAAFTDSNPSLTTRLYKDYHTQTLPPGQWLASLRVSQVRAVIDSVATTGFVYPDYVTGTTSAEKNQHYAEVICDSVAKAFPTEAISARINEDAATPFSELYSTLDTFIAQNPGFDLRTVSADNLATDHSYNFSAVANKAGFLEDLNIVQRLVNVTTDYSLIADLAKNGVHSSQKIARMSFDDFAAQYSNQSRSAVQLQAIYDTAVSNATYALFLAIENFNAMNTKQIAVLSRNKTGTSTPYAEWENLFGTLDGCNCSHCQSVYSPAAYLTDLLEFLKRNNQAAYDELVKRRPDIINIELVCKNINTPVPHIDIVNELLEDLVYAVTTAPIHSMPGRQTLMQKCSALCPNILTPHPEMLHTMH